MALSGFNLVLASSGQEEAWKETFRRFGGTEEGLDRAHFTGAAFLPWNRMGNLRGWGAPLGQGWMNEDSKLQNKILQRLRYGFVYKNKKKNG